MSDFERQHLAAAIVRPLAIVRQNLVTFAIIIFFGISKSDESYSLYFLFAGIIISIVAGFLSWWKYRFRVYEDELQIQYGVIIRKKLHISIDRIQVVDITAGILQRIFGLVQIEIKTAGRGTENATINAISVEKAKELQQLLQTKQDTKQQHETEIEGEKPEELLFEEPALKSRPVNEREIFAQRKLPFGELIFAAATSGNFGLIASIVGAVLSQADLFMNEESVGFLEKNASFFSNFMLLFGLFLLFMLIGWLLSFFGVVVQFMDFKVEKTEKQLMFSSGLFERKYVTVPFNRIQAVRIRESLIRIPFKRAMIYLESAGFDSKGHTSVVAFPFIKIDDIPAFLEEFLPEYIQLETQLKPSKKAKFRYIVRPTIFWLILFGAGSIFYSTSFIAGLFWCIPIGYLGYKNYKGSGIALTGDLIQLKDRFFTKTTVIAPRKRIQSVDISENPVQQLKELTHFSFTVASGMGGRTFKIKDIDKTDGQRVLEWYSHHPLF